MNAVRLSLSLAAILLAAAPSLAELVNYELVPVGDPGNAADTTGYGAVAYDYQMGKYEVTIGQYAAFLNAVAKADPYSLYNPNMGTGLNIAGISRTGVSGSYSYSAIGPSGTTLAGASSPGNRPITYTSWFVAARFANWMSNGQPVGPQGAATTENGAYNLNGATSGSAPAFNVTNPNIGSVPIYRIPTEDQWYKAAYYKGGSTNAGYWDYATQSDTAPGNVIGSGSNQANYRYTTDILTVTQSGSLSSSQNYLTDVGAFTASPSAYGTFDQNGNVWEWNDLNGEAGDQRGTRGGNWHFTVPRPNWLNSSSGPDPRSTTLNWMDGGFRLASPVAVPEPSTYAMALAGLACGGYSMFRRRKRS